MAKNPITNEIKPAYPYSNTHEARKYLNLCDTNSLPLKTNHSTLVKKQPAKSKAPSV
jgi:hypothetical protein